VVGKLRKPHGVQGEMAMEVLTDFPERLVVGSTLYVGKNYRPLQVNSLRWHGSRILVTFQGMTTPEEVGEWRNTWVYVRTEEIPSLEAGEYYHHQMLGLQVISEEAERLGHITDILETGSNDVLVVQPESGAEILLPFTDEVIQEINLDEGIIRVRLTPGLLP
jgi:16S rRNA processing protein RimM